MEWDERETAGLPEDRVGGEDAVGKEGEIMEENSL